MTSVEMLTQAFDALESGNIVTFAAFCAPQATIWHNYDRQTKPLVSIFARLRTLHASTRIIRYNHRKYIALEEGALAEHVLEGAARGGHVFAAPMMARFYTDADAIHHIDEYLDPAQLAQVRGDPAHEAPQNI